MIDHQVHRVAPFAQESDNGTQENFRTYSANRRQYDKARVNFLSTDQGAEITGILCYEDEILFYASSQYSMVRCTEPPKVTWMYRDVGTVGIQGLSNPRRHTLIEEQLHCVATTMTQESFCQGRPDGRPRNG